MEYRIELKPRATRDLGDLPKQTAQRILRRIGAMRDDLSGDVKRLTNYSPEYRLRVGEYRVLFEVEGDRVMIYRVRHRREAYRR